MILESSYVLEIGRESGVWEFNGDKVPLFLSAIQAYNPLSLRRM